MAHRLESRDDTDRHTSEETDPAPGRLGRVGRRSYVKLGLAGIVATLVGSGGAAADESEMPGDDAPTKRILIRPNSGVTRYEITVDGRLRPGTGTARDAAARISGSSAEGIVKDDDRRYRFDGALQDLAIEGDAGVYVGTERIDPE